ncbi:hypothetical protein GIX45_17040 [Erwinia sp. CPCC 100877]|nr:hypothetical protein [Erwinia sp. CPCC 100877]
MMFAIYCNDDNLLGFVTGQYVYQGSVFVSTARLNDETIGKIKLYKSRKRAENGIRSYENVYKDKFEIKELTEGEVQLIIEAKKSLERKENLKMSLFNQTINDVYSRVFNRLMSKYPELKEDELRTCIENNSTSFEELLLSSEMRFFLKSETTMNQMKADYVRRIIDEVSLYQLKNSE